MKTKEERRLATKNLIRIILAAVMLFAGMTGYADTAPQNSYAVWVGGIQVTDANRTGITGTGLTGQISYDPYTSTLTLSSAIITGSRSDSDDQYGIYSGGDIKIDLIGSSAVMLTGADVYRCFGIFAEGSVTFGGSGSLTVTAGKAKYISAAVECGGSFTNSASLILSGGYGYYKNSVGIQGFSYGLYTGGNITNTSAGKITAVNTSTLAGAAVYCLGSVNNSGQMTASCAAMDFDSIGLYASELTNSGTLEAGVLSDDYYSEGDSYGIRVLNSFTNHGTVAASSRKGTNTFGLSAAVMKNTGSINAVADMASANAKGVSISGTLTNSGAVSAFSNGGGFKSGISCGLSVQTLTNQKSSRIQAFSAEAHTSYGLYASAVTNAGNLMALSDAQYADISYGLYTTVSLKNSGPGSMIRTSGYTKAINTENSGIAVDPGTVIRGHRNGCDSDGTYSSAFLSGDGRNILMETDGSTARSVILSEIPSDLILDRCYGADDCPVEEFGNSVPYDFGAVSEISEDSAYSYQISIRVRKPIENNYTLLDSGKNISLSGQYRLEKTGEHVFLEQISLMTGDGIPLASVWKTVKVTAQKRTLHSVDLNGSVEYGTELNMGYTLTCPDPHVKSCEAVWYRNARNLHVDQRPCYADEAVYRACLTLTAQDNYRFDEKTELNALGGTCYPSQIRSGGTVAEYWVSTVVVCHHEADSWSTDDVMHWKLCDRCYTKFDEAEHIWVKQSETMETVTWVCSVCSEVKTTQTGMSALRWTRLVMDDVEPGKPLPVPAVYRQDTAELIGYHWNYPDETGGLRPVDNDSPAAEGSYYLQILLKPKEGFYYRDDAYAYIDNDQSHTHELNSDGSMSAVIEMESRFPVEVDFSLPEVSAGMTMKTIRENFSITTDGTDPMVIGLTVSTVEEETKACAQYSFIDGEWQSGDPEMTLEEMDALQILTGTEYMIMGVAFLPEKTSENAVRVDKANSIECQLQFPLGYTMPMLTALYFSEPLYQIDAEAEGGGMATGSGTYSLGDYAELTAYTGPGGKSFFGWIHEGSLVSRENPLRWSVTDDAKLTALFIDTDSILSLPSSLKQIGSEAFTGTNAEVIIIPAGCTEAADDAFDGCENLRYIMNGSSLPLSAPGGVRIIDIEPSLQF